MVKTKVRTGLIAALDVGTTKTVCFIARAGDEGLLRVQGIGHQISRGIRAGAVIDMDEAEHAIRTTVEAAESMMDERISEVIVNLSGGQPLSRIVHVENAINGHEIGEADIRRMQDLARQHYTLPDRDLVHALTLDYSIDENRFIRDPRGMFGDRLGLSVHIIHAASGQVRNLRTVINRCHLDIEARVVSPFASALACLVEDEKHLGVTCIDMGGGTTSIAVFSEGQLRHTGIIPIGGQHVTSDIARCLSTPITSAERIKTLYGSATSSPSDEHEILKIPLIGEDEDHGANLSQIPQSLLCQIIQPRLEETFEMVRNHLNDAGIAPTVGRRVVLTGGASQMQGIRDLAALVLDKQVRLGRPVGYQGLAEATHGPAFSTCAGLLRYGLLSQTDFQPGTGHGKGSNINLFAKAGQWFKQNF